MSGEYSRKLAEETWGPRRGRQTVLVNEEKGYQLHCWVAPEGFSVQAEILSLKGKRVYPDPIRLDEFWDGMVVVAMKLTDEHEDKVNLDPVLTNIFSHIDRLMATVLWPTIQRVTEARTDGLTVRNLADAEFNCKGSAHHVSISLVDERREPGTGTIVVNDVDERKNIVELVPCRRGGYYVLVNPSEVVGVIERDGRLAPAA